MKKEVWHVPQYYPLFSCKADKCRHTCCSSWKIPISRKEYLKLVDMDCSDELYRRVQLAFEEPEVITEQRFRYICFNWLGDCQLMDKGLCSVHREKGTGFLPKICRLYPRSLKRVNDINVACCSCSCEAVLELLMQDNELHFTTIESEDTPEIISNVSDEDVKKIKLFQDIVKDRSTTLTESLIQICTIVNKDEFEKDYNSTADPLQAALSLLERLSSSNDRLQEAVTPIIERYTASPESYADDVRRFEKDYPDWMKFFERIINNSMIYENFPFVDSRFDDTACYKGLCVCYGLMRVVAIGNHFFHDSREDLIDALSALFHLIDHTAFYYNVHVIVENAAVMLKL